MTTNDIKNEIKNGNTVRVRKAVRNALRSKVLAAIKGGFSADCEFDKLDYLVFTDNAVCAGAAGIIDCRHHTFEVAIPYADIN